MGRRAGVACCRAPLRTDARSNGRLFGTLVTQVFIHSVPRPFTAFWSAGDKAATVKQSSLSRASPSVDGGRGVDILGDADAGSAAADDAAGAGVHYAAAAGNDFTTAVQGAKATKAAA